MVRKECGLSTPKAKEQATNLRGKKLTSRDQKDRSLPQSREKTEVKGRWYGQEIDMPALYKQEKMVGLCKWEIFFFPPSRV